MLYNTTIHHIALETVSPMMQTVTTLQIATLCVYFCVLVCGMTLRKPARVCWCVYMCGCVCVRVRVRVCVRACKLGWFGACMNVEGCSTCIFSMVLAHLHL